ncbi:glycosyltransferase [Planctomycetota bacterium]
MRVFMLGWEFPPFISGGLGTACYGLTKAMSELGLGITFCLPKMVDSQYTTHVKMLGPGVQRPVSSFKLRAMKNVDFHAVNSPLKAYATPETYQKRLEELILQKRKLSGGNITIGEQLNFSSDYSGDMYTEAHRYAALSAELALDEDFDVIHAHDWMTYPAGIAVAKVSGKPLIIHVHATEFDRSGENINQMIYDIEREGMHVADKIIAVSYYTRNIIINRYGISPDKVEVVHNGIESKKRYKFGDQYIEKDEKMVLFLGRITMQKGPEYFLHAAKKVLEVMDNVKFVMAGSGDMMHRAVEMAAELGIGSKVLFTGFLQGKGVQKIYEMADLFVMPSVSEPFGLVPLEALDHDVPVIISKQSGVSEVLTHALKVDFWDTEEIANKIVAVLKHPSLRITLQNHGNHEVRKLRWKDSAAKCARIYHDTMVAV